MMNSEQMNFVMLPQKEWEGVKQTLEEIKFQVTASAEKKAPAPGSNYISAKEFMEAVRIKRSRFAKLVNANKIKAIKKGRRIYVPVTEVERYFMDKGIF